MKLVLLMRASVGGENPRGIHPLLFCVAVASGMGSACMCLFSLPVPTAASCLLQAVEHWE